MWLRLHKGERIPIRDGGKGGGQLLFHPLDGVLVLDDLDAGGLSLAAFDEAERGGVAQVLETLARAPAGIHLLDVLGGEVVAGDGALALELNVEAAEFAEHHLVALKELFADAGHHVGDDTLDDALREGTVVRSHVACEVIEAEHLASLCGAIGLGLLDLVFLRAWGRAHHCNTVVNHMWPPPILPKGRLECLQ